MDFTTISIWTYLIPPILMAWLGGILLRGNPNALLLLRKILILVTSFTLLGLASWQTLIVFFLLSIVTFYGCKFGLTLETPKRKLLLWVLLPLTLTPLFVYKYANFFGNQVFDQEWDSFRDLIIPVGISFYSFQMIAFCVDTLMQSMRMPKLLDYLNFGAFFPQIVAGPIERRSLLLPQLETLQSEQKLSDNLNMGLRYIILGTFYKLVLSDNVGLGIQNSASFHSAYEIYLLNFLFTFRIYFDFAGYSLIAFGLARCLGIEITLNFKSPLTAFNIGEYWRRWHASLSTWLRDYIYFPLGGSRTKLWAINIIIVFAVSGLWHGANWNFVIWGLSLGVGLIVFRIFHRAGYSLWAPLAFIVTTFYTVNTRMFFYITDMGQIKNNLIMLGTPKAYAFADLSSEAFYIGMFRTLDAAFFILPLIIICLFLEFWAIRKNQGPYDILLTTPAMATQIFLIFFFTPGISNQFVYFAF